MNARMNDCAHAGERLSRLVHGELEEAERAGVLAHLAGCAACAARHRDLEATVRLLREGLAREAAPRLPDARRAELHGILSAILADGERRRRRWFRRPATLAAAASVLLGLVLSTLLLPSLGRARTSLLGGAARPVSDDVQIKPDGDVRVETPACKEVDASAADAETAPKAPTPAPSLQPAKPESRAAAPASSQPFAPMAQSGKRLALEKKEQVLREEPGPLDVGGMAMARRNDAKDAEMLADRATVVDARGRSQSSASATALARAATRQSATGGIGFATAEREQARTAQASPAEKIGVKERALDKALDRQVAAPLAKAAGQKQAMPVPSALPAQSCPPGQTGQAADQAVLQAGEFAQRADTDALRRAKPAVPLPVSPFVMTADDRLSTFALDTDHASYDIARRYVAEGALPPAALVRTEEFVNAFDYHYPVRGKGAFSIHLDGAPSPFGRGLVLLRVGIQARQASLERPCHLVVVVDTSSSMGRADRLPLARLALRELQTRLGAGDRVSLVATREKSVILLQYASAWDAAVPGAIESLQADGATNLETGLLAGMDLAERHFLPQGENRVILLSDGVANVGQTDSRRLLERLERFRKAGIGLSTVGFGKGTYDDSALEQLANRCDGGYFYVDSEEDARHRFPAEFRASLDLAARDARVQVEFLPGVVRRYRLLGYEDRDLPDTDFRRDGVDAGEVAAGTGATALYEIELAETGQAAGQLGRVHVRWQDARSGRFEETNRAITTMELRPATPADNPRLFLAAAAAEYAEILRNSPHAADGSLPDVIRLTEQVVDALPFDASARGFLDLVRQSRGLPLSKE